MMSMLPAQPLDNGQVTYADVAGQREALGAVAIPASEGEREAWFAATQGLALPANGLKMATDNWKEIFGFDLYDVDQAVEFSAPPNVVTIMRGRFDEAALIQAWEQQGYQPVEFQGTTYYSVADDFEIDVSSPRSQLALASMNKLALIDGEYLVASSAQSGVEGVIQARDGTRPSMADDIAIAPLVRTIPSDLVSAVIVAGSAFAGGFDPASILDMEGTPGPPDVDAIATQIAEAEEEARRMPIVAAGLLGMTAGRTTLSAGEATPAATPATAPTAKLIAAVTTTSPTDAEAAAAVIDDRLANQAAPEQAGGRSYADLFPERTVSAVPGEPVVIAELTPGPETSPSILLNLLFSRGLTFLAWSP
jgi:hypothetical protein